MGSPLSPWHVRRHMGVRTRLASFLTLRAMYGAATPEWAISNKYKAHELEAT
jgi:hypothetical protein